MHLVIASRVYTVIKELERSGRAVRVGGCMLETRFTDTHETVRIVTRDTLKRRLRGIREFTWETYQCHLTADEEALLAGRDGQYRRKI